VPARFFLAQALKESGQTDAARDGFLQVVHDDCGRTELSMVSLNELAAISAAAGKDLAAVDCLAWSLMIDRAHGRTLQVLGPLLEKLKWANESRRLAALTTAAGGSAAVANGKLPVLPAPPAARALSADQIYKASAPSVVLIRAGQSSGTGVCVGRAGIIVTSRHVITGADAISVYPFVVENNRTRRLARLTAHAILVDAADDLAVLAVDDPPASLTPLPVALASPGAGKAVYAIGNPGLGPQTLDLSLSQGIVSTASRMIDGHPYLQHTASVNPGNSGGPLISDTGQVVGIVCLKAQLEGVSFATPIEKVRALFPAAGPPARP
jgi:S1-C subfamily serine protease